MTARTKLLTATLALALCVGTAVGRQPPAGEVTPQQIQDLRQQLSMLSQIQGMKPEDRQRFLEQFQNNGPLAKWAEQFLKPPGGKPPIAPGQPGPQPIPQPMGPGEPNPPPFPMEPRLNNGPGGPGLEMPRARPKPPGPGGDPWRQPDDFNPGQDMPRDFDPGRPPQQNFKPPIDPKFGGNPNAAELAKLWENNVGPLDQTPAVRDAILDLFAAGKDGGFGDGDWKDLLDEFNKNGGNGDNDGLGDWFKEMNFEGEKWDWGDWGHWDFPKWGGDGGGNNFGNNNAGGGGWNWNFGGGGGGSFGGGGAGSWLPVILLVVIAVGALLAWKFWPMLARRESAAAAGVRVLERWPVDPRRINSRAELVKAFEYLSVLLCGDAARVWNHETIARALRMQIPHSDLVADELAKLYELARYTPPGEPLPPSALADARRCLCHLAGVSA